MARGIVAELVGSTGRAWTGDCGDPQQGLIGEARLGESRKVSGARPVRVAIEESIKTLAVGDDRGTVLLLRWKENRYRRVKVGGVATSLAFAQPRLLLVGLANGSLRALDPLSGEVAKRSPVSPHRAPVRGISIAPTRNAVVTTSPDIVAVWDLPDMKRPAVIAAGPYGAEEARLDEESGCIIASYSGGELASFDARGLDLEVELRLPGNERPVGLALLDGKAMVAALGNGGIHIGDMRSGRVEATYELPSSSAPGRHILGVPKRPCFAAIVGNNGAFAIIDCLRGAQRGVLPTTRPVLEATIGSDGSYVGVISGDGIVAIYDLERALACQGGPPKAMPMAEWSAGRNDSAPPPAVQRERRQETTRQLHSASAGQKSFEERVKTLLGAYGELPERHRGKAWERLLHLPNNTEAYNALLGKSGVSRKGRAERALLALGRWAPASQNTEEGRRLMEPLVRAMASMRGEVAAFELAAHCLLNACSSFLENLPHPPREACCEVVNLALLKEPTLESEVLRRNIRLRRLAWVPLSDLFHSCLPEEQWLAVLDNCFAEGPFFLRCATAAFLILTKPTWLKCTSERDAIEALHRMHAISAHSSLLPLARHLRASALAAGDEVQRFPSSRLGVTEVAIPEQGPLPAFTGLPARDLGAEAQERASIAQHLASIDP